MSSLGASSVRECGHEHTTYWWHGCEAVQVVGDSAYGGGVTVVLAIAEACASIGLRPVILATNPDVVRAALQRGVEVWEHPGIVRKPQVVRDLFAAVRLALALRRRGVQIVHTHTSKGGMVGRLGAWLAGCRLIVHHTHGFYHQGLRSGPKRWSMQALERLFGVFGQFQIFLTLDEANHAITRHIVPSHKVRIVANGVADPLCGQPPGRGELLQEWDLEPEATLIGTVGRLDIEQKGLDTGLRAFALLLREHPTARYVIVGKGDDEDRLRALARELGIEQAVRFVGHRTDASELLRAFHVCFYPSVREGQSIAVLEAMGCGRPIVATRITGTSGLVLHEANALVCEVGDERGMEAALSLLLTDTVLAEKLGCQARQDFVSEFTWERFVGRLRDVYLEMLSQC